VPRATGSPWANLVSKPASPAQAKVAEGDIYTNGIGVVTYIPINLLISLKEFACYYREKQLKIQ
jgi:hypothetical protein